MRIEAQVLQSDINDAWEADTLSEPARCPVARALRRHFPGAAISVSRGFVLVFPGGRRTVKLRASGPTMLWIIENDRGCVMDPFTAQYEVID